MKARLLVIATLTAGLLWAGLRQQPVAAPGPRPTQAPETAAAQAPLAGSQAAAQPAPSVIQSSQVPPALPGSPGIGDAEATPPTSAQNPAQVAPPVFPSEVAVPAPAQPAGSPAVAAGPETVTAQEKPPVDLPPLGPSGGKTTIRNGGVDSFSFPARNLKRSERGAFQVGSSFFNRNWVFAPASTKGRDGLGPFFNSRSCSACHFKDGRGEAPDGPTDELSSILIRWSAPHGPAGEIQAIPNYGLQMQDHGAPDVAPEAKAHFHWEAVPFTYPDGTKVTLRQPRIEFSDLAYGPLPKDVRVSARVATTMAGLGLLEALAASEVLAGADPDDTNGDGISGRANMVPEALTQKQVLGRFGWKAGQPTVKQQSAAAFLGDMGLTTSLFPNENVFAGQHQAVAFPNGGSPEVSDASLDRITAYASTLAVPARRPGKDGLFDEGRRLFHQAGCVACHRETWTTGTSTRSKALSHQVIHPYTDLLLHDMGPGLADNRPEFGASGSEWRTPPLWGLGLVDLVNAHTNFLHDGRAEDYEHAVLWHDGEARESRDAFANLTAKEREALLAFLERL